MNFWTHPPVKPLLALCYSHHRGLVHHWISSPWILNSKSSMKLLHGSYFYTKISCLNKIKINIFFIWNSACTFHRQIIFLTQVTITKDVETFIESISPSGEFSGRNKRRVRRIFGSGVLLLTIMLNIVFHTKDVFGHFKFLSTTGHYNDVKCSVVMRSVVCCIVM